MEVKPKRKLKKAPITETTKIEYKPTEFLYSEEERGVTKKKTPKTSNSETSKCEHCGKEFKDLKQHYTKSHLKFNIHFKMDKKHNKYLMTVTDQTGKVYAKNLDSDSTTDEFTEYFFLLNEDDEYSDGLHVQLYNNKTIKVRTDKRLKNKQYKEGPAFKNWTVKFD
jgi:uncharacterized FlaG/YvyC family protein